MTTLNMPAGEETTAGLPSDSEEGRRTDELVISYLPLVKATAARIRDLLPENCGVEFADLAQAGCIGLIKSSQSYDPRCGVSFALYARYRIRGEILDMLRDLDTLSRRFRRWKKLVDNVTEDLTTRLLREPSEDEVFEACGEQSSPAWDKNRSLLGHGLLSQAQLLEEPHDGPETRPDAICSRTQVQSILQAVMRTLPERSQRLLLLYYREELTMREIATIMNVNESRVSQMHKRALRAVADGLRSSGIRRSADLRATA
jgi:RNA polymerase sigma factor for flagellar operon FliA